MVEKAFELDKIAILLVKNILGDSKRIHFLNICCRKWQNMFQKILKKMVKKLDLKLQKEHFEMVNID